MNGFESISLLLLWPLALAQGFVIFVMLRHIGVLYERIGPVGALTAQSPLAIGERVPINTRAGLRQLRAQLWTRPGVFLSGATERQARRWAMRQARPFGGRVRAVDQHPGGRPHFHIEFPPGAPAPVQRSGHIFYGNPPAGSFFEFDYL